MCNKLFFVTGNRIVSETEVVRGAGELWFPDHCAKIIILPLWNLVHIWALCFDCAFWVPIAIAYIYMNTTGALRSHLKLYEMCQLLRASSGLRPLVDIAPALRARVYACPPDRDHCPLLAPPSLQFSNPGYTTALPRIHIKGSGVAYYFYII